MTEFTKSAIAQIRKIPRGKVATYGQIAALAGRSGAARAVVWILHSSSKKHRLPWHRVLNTRGEIPFPKGSSHYKKQHALLVKEKIVFTNPGRVDMKRSHWKKKPAKKRALPRMFSKG